MRRVVNLRTMLTVAVCETVMILLVYLSYVQHSAGVALLIAFYALLGIGAACSYIFGKNRQLLLALVLCIVFGGITHIVMTVRYNTYQTITVDSAQTYVVHGTVDTVTAKNGWVSAVSVRGVKIDAKEILGKVQIVFSEDTVPEQEIPLGCSITASGSLYAVQLINGTTVNGTAYRKNIRYTLYASYDLTQTAPQKGSLLLRMRNALHDRLIAACGDTYGSVAYCMLTGDKSELDAATLRMYSVSGIGHVLAVSGLHVGLLTAMAMFLLRKLHVPRVVQVCIVSVLLIAYAAFVGFSASVVRSCIMCIIAMLTLVNGQRKDALSSLSLAYAVILAAQPFLLFEVGFLLSFTAVFGLVLFSKTFTAALRRIHAPQWIAAPLGATGAVHVGILPVTAYFFGAVQTYSVIFNLLLVPVLSVTFAFFVIVAPISTLLHVNVLLRISAVGFAFTDIFTGITAYLPLSRLYLSSHAAIFCLYPLYFAASRFFMLPKAKWMMSLCCSVLCAVLAAIPTLVTLSPDKEVQDGIILVNSYGDVTSIVVDDTVTVIGDCKDTSAIKAAMQRYHIRALDTVILHKLTEEIGSALSEFVREYAVGKIVCPADGLYPDGLAALGHYKRLYVWEECDVPKTERVVTASLRHAGYLYAFSEEVTVLFMGYASSYADIPVSTVDRAPIVRCFMYLNRFPDRIYLTNMPKGYLGEYPKYQYSLADDGPFVFDTRQGILQKNNG